MNFCDNFIVNSSLKAINFERHIEIEPVNLKTNQENYL